MLEFQHILDGTLVAGGCASVALGLIGFIFSALEKDRLFILVSLFSIAMGALMAWLGLNPISVFSRPPNGDEIALGFKLVGLALTAIVCVYWGVIRG